MSRQLEHYTPELIVTLLQQLEAEIVSGKSTARDICLLSAGCEPNKTRGGATANLLRTGLIGRQRYTTIPRPGGACARAHSYEQNPMGKTR
jgi:hypothetical protein